MSRLTFTMRHAPDQRLDLSPLVPDRLAGKSETEIARIVISTTRETVRVGDAFRIAMGDVHDMVFRRAHAGLDRIGARLKAGAITVSGDAGAYCGAAMTGGTIRVSGSAGYGAGIAMAGGALEIGGDAGDFCGGSFAGHMAGMTGGVLVVRGSAGARAGDRMRRGLVAIGGNCGALAGSRMIAGTLLVTGKLGPRPGMLMRRGTILAGSARDIHILPTFADCGIMSSPFARLYRLGIEEAGVRWSGEWLPQTLRRLAGDMSTIGKGEILLPA